jgi:hypothetical protein
MVSRLMPVILPRLPDSGKALPPRQVATGRV